MRMFKFAVANAGREFSLTPPLIIVGVMTVLTNALETGFSDNFFRILFLNNHLLFNASFVLPLQKGFNVFNISAVGFTNRIFIGCLLIFEMASARRAIAVSFGGAEECPLIA